MVTTRLYQQDAYLRQFDARVVDRSEDGRRIYLDRTAFYPTSGGQPHDTGKIAEAEVVDVIDEGQRIAHLTAAPVTGELVACSIDWPRRFDHMQQHSGQHLLSAVFAQRFGWNTVSFHLGAEISTIELDTPSAETAQLREAEERANQFVFDNLPVTISFEAAEAARDLRKPSEREGVLRVVTIKGVDRSACGGTHVRSTGEIGPVAIRKMDKIRDHVRLEFLCGWRTIRRSSADFDALSRIALLLSTSLEEAPGLVEETRRRMLALEKSYRRARIELALRQGRELYGSVDPGPDGVRKTVYRIPGGPLEEDLRAMAQGFTQGSRAVFVAASAQPPGVLLAVSGDSGVHAAERLKEALEKVGGRGGGNALMAQGSLPSVEALEAVLRVLGGAP